MVDAWCASVVWVFDVKYGHFPFDDAGICSVGSDGQ